MRGKVRAGESIDPATLARRSGVHFQNRGTRPRLWSRTGDFELASLLARRLPSIPGDLVQEGHVRFPEIALPESSRAEGAMKGRSRAALLSVLLSVPSVAQTNFVRNSISLILTKRSRSNNWRTLSEFTARIFDLMRAGQLSSVVGRCNRPGAGEQSGCRDRAISPRRIRRNSDITRTAGGGLHRVEAQLAGGRTSCLPELAVPTGPCSPL